MSDGLKEWASFIQLNALIKQVIRKKTPKEDCQICMSLVDQAISNPAEKRVIFYICMELLQNVSHHAMRFTNKTFLGTFFFHQDEKNWYILSTNSIKQANVKPLRNKLDQINGLHQDSMALKKLYKDIIQADEPISKHAGLGLLDIVRKSKHALHYKFEENSGGNSVFTLMVTIEKR